MDFDESELSRLAENAIAFDKAGKHEAALSLYAQLAGDLVSAAARGQLDETSARAKAAEYIDRAEKLRSITVNKGMGRQKSIEQLGCERAEFLLKQALDEDEKGNSAEAVSLYMQSIQMCLELRKEVSARDSQLAEKLRCLAEQALERAEALKGVQSTSTDHLGDEFDRLQVTAAGHSDSASPCPSPTAQRKHPVTRRQGSVYSNAELAVLRHTSRINGRNYVPFLAVDVNERFAYPLPFSDPNGYLPLSQKQKSKLAKWARPDELFENPSVITKIDSGAIKQTIVSDCSFVASLAVAAKYENKTGKQLVTKCIYPQNRQGKPVHNPCGKYMVKFIINGIPRKVIIDDYLPVGHMGELLCSHSQRKGELWVSLLEKAYLKVMGGYDFPGSNSNTDLHALTGWIPDRVPIPSANKPDSTFNESATFEQLFSRLHAGHCVITLATGQIPQAEADRAGLVECHAYAVLDIRKVEGKRMFMVKNPWTHLRWKGRYSERDLTNWTPSLKKALDYNPDDAQQYDDGVFWIDYDSVLHFFDVFYLSWDPDLFPHTYCVHSSWDAGVGPVKDLYSMGDNPQFRLSVQATQKASVWVLLSRHIVDRVDFADNREFITVLVYKTGGKRVYYPYDPRPYIDGVRINSPHYLIKIPLDDNGEHNFTLVVAQYEKTNTIYYTLRAYATCPFKMSKLDDIFVHKKKESGAWTASSAGGCANYRDTYGSNPVYQVQLSQDNVSLLVELRGPKQYSVGVDVRQVSGDRPFELATSGTFRRGYCALELHQVPSGSYNIVPATFLQNQLGPFILSVGASAKFKLTKMQ